MKRPAMLPASSQHPHFYSLQHRPRTKQAYLPPMPHMALVPLVHSNKHVLPRALQRICIRLDGRGGEGPGTGTNSVAAFLLVGCLLLIAAILIAAVVFVFGTSMPPHLLLFLVDSSSTRSPLSNIPPGQYPPYFPPTFSSIL